MRGRSTGGWGGWGLGNPDGTVCPPARRSGAGTPGPTYDDGFPKAPPTPPALSPVLTVGSTTPVARVSFAPLRDCGPPAFLPHAGFRSARIVGQSPHRPSMHRPSGHTPPGGSR